MSNQPILQVRKLSQRFLGAPRPTLRDVSLSLRRGEVACLVGPSGGGKSTLLRTLVGLELFQSGSITLAGRQMIRARTPQAEREVLLRQLGTYVFQDFALWPDKTVLENITLAPMLLQGVGRERATKEAQALLRKFGLAGKEHAYPEFLSGGQKQRVAIIRALATKPEVLYLDEITSALDPELVKGVLDLIKVLAKEGQSMILATHHLKFASEVADTILFLEDGRLLQAASPRDFLYAQRNQRIQEFVKTLSISKNEINVYEGFDQFQAFQLGTINRMRPGAVKHVMVSTGDRWHRAMGRSYEQYERERLQKGMVWRMLMYEESPLDRDLRLRHPKLNQYRIVPRHVQQPANYYVLEDVVVIQIIPEDGEPAVIEIKNVAVAESYLNYFNLLWEQGRAPK